MANSPNNSVFLSYSPQNQDAVEHLARQLQGEARLRFWFAPWYSVPGMPLQEQMETALRQAQVCAVFINRDAISLAGWQNEQLRAAIQTRVEDDPGYRIIPVLLPGVNSSRQLELPAFLRRYETVEFSSLDDERAFKRLLAGILGIPPIQVEGYLQLAANQARLPPPASGQFERGQALIIGIARYPNLHPLPETVLNDARDLAALLLDPARCGYPPANVTQLLDREATGTNIRAAIAELARRTAADDTAVVFFSGHGACTTQGGVSQHYLLPYDCDPNNLPDSAIVGTEMTALLQAIQASRMLVMFDCCHSAGVGDPKAIGLEASFKRGLDENYYQQLAQGKGRVVIASSRSHESSWILPNMRNSLFTHYLLEALRGQARTLGDGYVRVFDTFRHIAEQVPQRADQHPIFKATALENDFPIALVNR